VAAWPTVATVLQDGLTLVRTRGIFKTWLTAAASIGDGFNEVAIGICVVTENAFGIGVTAIPGPLADMGWDGWLYHALLGPLISLRTDPQAVDSLALITHVVDSKAMRKLRDTDGIVGLVEYGVEQGTAVAEFGATTRILTKLP